MIPSLGQGADISKQAEAIRRETQKKQEEQEFLKNYLVTMQQAIEKDMQNIDEYFPEELTSKNSPMFKDEQTSLSDETLKEMATD